MTKKNTHYLLKYYVLKSFLLKSEFIMNREVFVFLILELQTHNNVVMVIYIKTLTKHYICY